MTAFSEKINLHWKNHADNTASVINELGDTFLLISNSDELDLFLNFLLHIYTEHKVDYSAMEQWLNIIEKNNKIRKSDTVELKIKVAKSLFVEKNISSFLDKTNSTIEFTLAGAFLINLNLLEEKFEESLRLFNQINERLQKETINQDTYKRVAILGNNIACRLEDLAPRTEVQNELMILAAIAARIYWEKAGTWLEVERAEYRLARTYQKAKDYINSIKHANLCLTICDNNKAPALELFFAYEAIAHVEKSIGQPLRSLEKMKNFYNQLSESDKQMCNESLEYFIIK